MPAGKWEFDERVTECFEDMLRRSIPQYDVMRAAVTTLARRHMRGPSLSVVDIGCSRGDALAPLIDVEEPASSFGGPRFIGLEISKPMAAVARERFAERGDVKILEHDLRTGLPEAPHLGTPAVMLSVLTLQFVPINYRQRILQQAYDALYTGGALIVVEKVLGEGARVDEEMVEVYHDLKARNGYTQEEIDRKRMALEGVLVPVTESWNRFMLERAGFDEIDCFWRWMNFAGWLALKR